MTDGHMCTTEPAGLSAAVSAYFAYADFTDADCWLGLTPASAGTRMSKKLHRGSEIETYDRRSVQRSGLIDVTGACVRYPAPLSRYRSLSGKPQTYFIPFIKYARTK